KIKELVPGEVVPNGFSFTQNAQVIGDELYLRDKYGNRISGRSVSNGDKITVLDIEYEKQLALVQYPAGNLVRQGYVTNNTNIIKYIDSYNWLY
ncbi:SH3 domain-containing protein, partial (plasmid) [Clostridium perfringens]